MALLFVSFQRKATLMHSDTKLQLEKVFPPLSAKMLNSSAILSNEVERLHRHPGFEIIWITSGSARLAVDMTEFHLTSGMVYCIAPGQIHSLQLACNTEGYSITFTNEFISQQDLSILFIYENGCSLCQPGLISISDEMQPFMRETLDRMLKEIDNFMLRREVLFNLLKLFLLDLTRHFEHKEAVKSLNSRNLDLMSRFLALLEKHYVQRKPVLFYANELHVTANYLNEVVKRISGFPASYHIHQRIIMEAKRQAAFALSTMKEVALNLGFDDFAHFSRFFKKNAGMNFTEFKREISGKVEMDRFASGKDRKASNKSVRFGKEAYALSCEHSSGYPAAS